MKGPPRHLRRGGFRVMHRVRCDRSSWREFARSTWYRLRGSQVGLLVEVRLPWSPPRSSYPPSRQPPSTHRRRRRASEPTRGINLAAQLLVYPVADVAGNFADAKQNARFPSRAENAEGYYFLSRAAMEWFAGHYLGDAKHGADWRVWSNSASTGHEGAVRIGPLVS
jgi:hypothetical protein